MSALAPLGAARGRGCTRAAPAPPLNMLTPAGSRRRTAPTARIGWPHLAHLPCRLRRHGRALASAVSSCCWRQSRRITTRAPTYAAVCWTLQQLHAEPGCCPPMVLVVAHRVCTTCTCWFKHSDLLRWHCSSACRGCCHSRPMGHGSKLAGGPATSCPPPKYPELELVGNAPWRPQTPWGTEWCVADHPRRPEIPARCAVLAEHATNSRPPPSPPLLSSFPLHPDHHNGSPVRLCGPAAGPGHWRCVWDFNSARWPLVCVRGAAIVALSRSRAECVVSSSGIVAGPVPRATARCASPFIQTQSTPPPSPLPRLVSAGKARREAHWAARGPRPAGCRARWSRRPRLPSKSAACKPFKIGRAHV